MFFDDFESIVSLPSNKNQKLERLGQTQLLERLNQLWMQFVQNINSNISDQKIILLKLITLAGQLDSSQLDVEQISTLAIQPNDLIIIGTKLHPSVRFLSFHFFSVEGLQNDLFF
jgi:hypothetical protein